MTEDTLRETFFGVSGVHTLAGLTFSERGETFATGNKPMNQGRSDGQAQVNS
jgi:hypothetical protein